MPHDLPPLVQRTIQRLIRAFSPKWILLFGSYAKGSKHAQSDVDLLVIGDLPENLAVHKRRAFQLAADSFPRIDVAFATPEEVACAATARSPFLLSILGSGVVIYERT